MVGRAIIRDLFDRDRAASMLGLVATVMVVVPTLGPLIGGLLDTAFGWESIFLFTAVTSVDGGGVGGAHAAGDAAASTCTPARARDSSAIWRSSRRARSSRAMCWPASFGSATFFAFLGGGPHVIVTLMGRTSAEYGVWFAISSIGYMAGNFAASRLSMRYGIDALIWWGIALRGARRGPRHRAGRHSRWIGDR